MFVDASVEGLQDRGSIPRISTKYKIKVFQKEDLF